MSIVNRVLYEEEEDVEIALYPASWNPVSSKQQAKEQEHYTRVITKKRHEYYNPETLSFWRSEDNEL